MSRGTLGDVPGEIATYLLGAQGGDEDAFARLYAATNPVLVRYLRVVSDQDAAALALATWPTLLRRLPACPADDDDWLELAVGSAREAAAAGTPVARAQVQPHPGTATGAAAQVDEAVEALRACGPESAEVLAM